MTFLNKLLNNIKKHKIIVITVSLLIIILIYILTGSPSGISVSEYTIKSSKLPEQFNNYKIVHISDYHNKDFGDNQNDLISKVADAKPDLIAITGDTINRDNNDITYVKQLLTGIKDIAPIYAISGNHEHSNPETFETLKELYNSYGITYLTNEWTKITKDNASINLYGVDYYDKTYLTGTYHRLSPLSDDSGFNIMLYHCSNYFDQICDYNFQLILAGHTHGGIIRLPLIGGLIDNDKSFFPKYSSGMYTKHGSTLIASRGLGDSFLPRIHNNPEIGIITLQH